MRYPSLIAAALACAGAGLVPVPAYAREQPYCASYGGFASYDSCGFATFEQCRATVLGAGGHCRPNPAYAGSVAGEAGRASRPRGHLR